MRIKTFNEEGKTRDERETCIPSAKPKNEMRGVCTRWLEKIDKIIIFITIVRPAGKALLNTFIEKFPFILSLLGSKANMKDGIPIVKQLVSVNCIGSKG